jgi:hypothetical protein
MVSAVIAPIAAFDRARVAFSGAILGAVLFADGGIEGQGGTRQRDKTYRCGQRRSYERHFFLPRYLRLLPI